MEIFHRELDGNLLLAICAAKTGWSVILGSKQNLFDLASFNPKGTYLLKSIVPGEYGIQKELKNLGNVIALHDQEGMLQRAGLEYKFRFSDQTIAITDHLFFWGKRQEKEFLEIFPNTEIKKLHISGSPRADYWTLISNAAKNLYLPKINPQKKIKRGQNYVLLATSFGNANHFIGLDAQKYLLKSVRSHDNLSEREEKKLDKNFEDRRELANKMLPIYSELLVELAKSNPELQIVVRPHPSEGEQYWRNLIKDFKNVTVNSQGSVTDWILGASCLVQYGSSTAIEANLLKVPVVTCIPDDMPLHLTKLHIGAPEAVSLVTHSAKAAVNTINDILSGRIKLNSKTPEEVHEILTGINDKNGASEKILNILNSSAIHTANDLHYQSSFTKVLKNKNLFREYFYHLLFKVPGFLQIVPKRHRHLKNGFAYRKRKIFNLNNDLINQKLNQISLLTEENLEGLDVSKYNGNCVKIELDDKHSLV